MSVGATAGPPEVSSKEPVPMTFFVKPLGSQLELDGAIVNHMRKLSIAPGPHTARLIPPIGGCCEPTPVTKSFEVKPHSGDGPPKPQTFSISAQIRPAKVRLSGPAGGTAVCGAYTFTVGQIEAIPMNAGAGEPIEDYRTIQAGATNELPWPPPAKSPAP
jgi:hypothetical protein